MNHPYREARSPESVFREECGVTACSCGVRRAILARMQRRMLWRVLAVAILAVGAGWTATALLCTRLTGRIVAAVEQLEGVAVAMNTASHAAAAPPPVCDRSPSPAPPVGPQWPIGLGILKLDWTDFVVDRRAIDVVLEEQAVIMGRVRTVRVSEDRRAVGVALFGVSPDTLFAQLGFQNGDVVQSIGGFDPGSQDEMLELYARLRSAGDLSVIVMRRGSKVQLTYHLV